ncbi:SCO6880 family protein [Acaricomes phytoseiuli]|uniref:SCO6880 family protein n=1 Tax=Acaricomes phytoseiuli TaxID=291968 RepID=UPI000361BA5C|nr:SCO6880 family protein [Acaricomes phytoseiuli]
MAESKVYESPTYGNWRKPAKSGYKSFSGVATVIMFGGLVIAVLAAMVNLVAGLVVAAVTGGALLALSVRDRHGKTIVNKVGEGLTGARLRASGSRVHNAVMVPGGKARLPGIAAAIEAVDVAAPNGTVFALLRNTAARVKTFTVVIGVDPDGGSLLDLADRDVQVARWGDFVSRFGEEDGLIGAAVVIESAPDTGHRLAQAVTSSIVDDAPALSKAVLAEAIDTSSTGNHRLSGFVTLTFSPRGKLANRPEQYMAALANRVPGFVARLAGTGGEAGRALSASEIAERVRIAYDPVVQDSIDQAHLDETPPVFSFKEAGPVATQRGFDTYRHDSGLSKSWVMTDAPRGHIYADRLAKLLGPHPDVARKRVAFLYRPVEAGSTAALVEKDLNAALVRVNGNPRPTARHQAELAHARQTAHEEATGAGLENFSVIVTATVMPGSVDGDELERAVIAVESTLAPSAKIRLRPAYGAQDTTFAASLPLGIILPEQAALPAYIREAM